MAALQWPHWAPGLNELSCNYLINATCLSDPLAASRTMCQSNMSQASAVGHRNHVAKATYFLKVSCKIVLRLMARFVWGSKIHTLFEREPQERRLWMDDETLCFVSLCWNSCIDVTCSVNKKISHYPIQGCLHLFRLCLKSFPSETRLSKQLKLHSYAALRTITQL
jgi:hypothetical protein